MAKLVKIWIEGDNKAIRIDWDNDRHQRIEINSDSPEDVALALFKARNLVELEESRGNI